MRYSKHIVALRTLGIAFAIVLSPAFMEMDSVTCHGVGDTRLASLELEVAGENLIAFDMEQLLYDVMLPEGADSAIVRAESVDPDADVSYNLSEACPPPIASGHFPTGGGEVTLDELTLGHTTLAIWVHAPEGQAECYVIHLTQPMLCE